MRRFILFLVLINSCLHGILAQGPGKLSGSTRISGIVVDSKGHPLAGASILIAGSWNGTTTDSLGKFELAPPAGRAEAPAARATAPAAGANHADTLVLKITHLGFQPQEKIVVLSGMSVPGERMTRSSDSGGGMQGSSNSGGRMQEGANSGPRLVIVLREEEAMLQHVVISAGNFEASDEKKTTVLKPFELATTPTAAPDVFSAIQELPGTSKVGESAGLFVRGGDASETKAVIDGMIVQDPFFSAVPGIAQKGRFSPLLFKGTSFSTGGYSAQYGQALSSVLVLNTQDLAQSSSVNATLSTAGLGANLTHRWDHISLGMNAGYFNMGPSNNFNKQNYAYNKAPEGGNGNLIFRVTGKQHSLLKIYASYSVNDLELQIPYVRQDSASPVFYLHGKNSYLNSSYRKDWDDWTLTAGFSHSSNTDSVISDTSRIRKSDARTQGRVMLTRKLAGRSRIYGGFEGQYVTWDNLSNAERYSLFNGMTACFLESEWYIGKGIAARAGIRQETSYTLHRSDWAPRISVAYILSKHSQVSFAYGDFYQLPKEAYLFTDRSLSFEKASHYILNYQLQKNDRTFRVEGYYKHYARLVREHSLQPFDPFAYDRIPSGAFDNGGYGYAKGIDLFWHDKRSIHDVDYWIAYSWLDTKRQSGNYPAEVLPAFAAHHNVSIVLKYTVPKTTLNLGFTYNYTSGRPYYDPHHAFLSDRTPAVNNLIFSGNYSWFRGHTMFALFAYVDNILGIRNVYNYAYAPDGLTRYTIYPPAFRSVFGGISITFSKHRSIMGIDF